MVGRVEGRVMANLERALRVQGQRGVGVPELKLAWDSGAEGGSPGRMIINIKSDAPSF